MDVRSIRAGGTKQPFVYACVDKQKQLATYPRAASSLGRALPWHGRGKGFESLAVHHKTPTDPVGILFHVKHYDDEMRGDCFM